MSSLPPSEPNQNKGFPWLGMFWGLVFSVAGILLAGIIFSRVIARPDLTANFPTPTLIILTSPPTVAPTETPLRATPTVRPSLTPTPTPDFTFAQLTLREGYFGVVQNTEGGYVVHLRAEPRVGNLPLADIPSGTAVFFLSGPEAGSGLTWWQVELPDGQTGWISDLYLFPAIKPLDWETNLQAQAIIPTATPFLSPTPVPRLRVGEFGVVANAGGVGVRFRPAPNTSNEPIAELPEGTFGEVVDGPYQGPTFSWWKIEIEDGTQGWLAADFLELTERPENWGQ